MARIGLISCARRKNQSRCKASELYDSPLFVKSRNYAVAHCEQWYILSAKHGLLEEDSIIGPYDETLTTMNVSKREEWAIGVWQKLSQKLISQDEVVVLAGIRYREFLVPLIEKHGCRVSIPLIGLSIGRQLQWLSQHT